MSDAPNDPISIGDLFAAFGASPADQGQAKSAPAKKEPAKPTARASAAEDADDGSSVVDVMAALGITPSASIRSSAASTKERKERTSAREEQIREQQIRSQQWQRELEEQQRRRQIQAQREAEREAEGEGPAAAQPQPKKGFGEDTTRIAEPSFLDKREAIEPAAAAQTEPLDTAQTRTLPDQEPAAQPAQAAVPQEPAAAIGGSPSSAAEPAQPDRQATIPVEAPAAEQAQAEPKPESAGSAAVTMPVGTIKPISESAAAASPQPAREVRPAPAAASSASVTQVITPISQSSSMKAAEKEPVPAPAAPAPIPAPMPIEAPAPMPRSAEPPREERRSVNKGNVLGIILIVIAFICAVLTVMLLTGAIDATTFSGLTGDAPTAQKTEEADLQMEEAASSGAAEAQTQAVYAYVVRGTDGGTYQATETASFGTDGKLESSSIVIDVPDESQAQGLLDQLKGDFGDAVQDSGTREGEVYLTIKIDRDDLDVDSYTELLSSNMAEFKVMETGPLE